MIAERGPALHKSHNIVALPDLEGSGLADGY
jgi:hypothetical protein